MLHGVNLTSPRRHCEVDCSFLLHQYRYKALRGTVWAILSNTKPLRLFFLIDRFTASRCALKGNKTQTPGLSLHLVIAEFCNSKPDRKVKPLKKTVKNLNSFLSWTILEEGVTWFWNKKTFIRQEKKGARQIWKSFLDCVSSSCSSMLYGPLATTR